MKVHIEEEVFYKGDIGSIHGIAPHKRPRWGLIERRPAESLTGWSDRFYGS